MTIFNFSINSLKFKKKYALSSNPKYKNHQFKKKSQWSEPQHKICKSK